MNERGSATILHLAIATAVLMLAAALAAATGNAAAKTHAVGLADVAAIAVAQSGTCEAAERVVERNKKYSLSLQRCAFDGGYAQVEIARGAPLRISATSRAGPTW